MKNSKIIGLIAALIPLVFIPIIPVSEDLTSAGVASICVLVTILVLLMTEALPIPISCLFGLALMIIFKAVPAPAAAFTGFSNPIVWFVLVSFGVSYSISSTNLSKRMLSTILGKFGNSTSTAILAIMICTAVLSSIISNVAAVIIFMTVSLDFLNIYDNEEDRKKTGRSMLIALPIASMIGGMITPAGSSLNLLCLSWLERLTELKVSFVQWMAIGIPMVIVLIPLAWKIVVAINKPVEVPKEKLAAYVEGIKIKEPFSFKEKYVTVVVLCMIICWILGSWYPVFNVTVVATVGVTLMFLPGVEVIKWNDLVQEISWAAIILVGSIICVGNILVESGASVWFVSHIMPQSLNLPAAAVVFIVAIIVFVMLIIIPVAPALISVMAAPLVGLAAAAGLSPIMLIMAMGLTVCNCFLLPFDTVPLITYMKGFYKKTELAKTAVLIQLANAVLVAIWLPIIIGVLGL